MVLFKLHIDFNLFGWNRLCKNSSDFVYFRRCALSSILSLNSCKCICITWIEILVWLGLMITRLRQHTKCRINRLVVASRVTFIDSVPVWYTSSNTSRIFLALVAIRISKPIQGQRHSKISPALYDRERVFTQTKYKGNESLQRLHYFPITITSFANKGKWYQKEKLSVFQIKLDQMLVQATDTLHFSMPVKFKIN